MDEIPTIGDALKHLRGKAMSRAYLHWEGPFTNVDHSALGLTMGIYMFVDNDSRYSNGFVPRRVLYIGMTYDQTFRDEIQAKLRGDVGKWMGENKFYVTVKIAHIQPVNQGRISEALVKDIESLLIIVHQPLGNIQNIQTYSGRDLVVFNRGKYKPLKEIVSANELGS